MTVLHVTDRSGATRIIETAAQASLMSVLRDAGFDEIIALCGGNLSCATCHVYIDGEQTASLPPIDEFESELLDCSEHRTASSRLSCQVPVTAALSGLHVTVAPED